jgi:hypothetical protein
LIAASLSSLNPASPKHRDREREREKERKTENPEKETF